MLDRNFTSRYRKTIRGLVQSEQLRSWLIISGTKIIGFAA